MNVRRVVIALATLVLLTTGLQAWASARIVRLSYVDGNVQIDRNRAVGVETAILNMPVVEGTRIMGEGPDARVEIEFENGSTMRLAGPSDVIFRQLDMSSNGDKETVVEIVRGVAYFDINIHDNDDFRVLLQDRDLTLRKSSHFRVLASDEETTLAVYKGAVELQGEANQVLVRKDETLTLDRGDSRYFLAKNVMPMEWDDFDKERNEYRDMYARSNAYSYAGVGYGNPYSYGLNDMAYYGAFNYYPGFGYLWRPAGYGIGWDPFSFGAWSYYPQFGWVYVSSYPWGWTPYRYGEWVFVPNYGWCWNPYGYGNAGYVNWYPVPRYRRPGPQHGHGPIPVPKVQPPQLAGGPTISVGGGGLRGRPEPGALALRPNPAEGPGRHGRPRGVEDQGGIATGVPIGPAASAPVVPAGSAITGSGHAVTPPAGAVTPAGGAVRSVVPGLREPMDDRRRQEPNRWQRTPQSQGPVSSAPASTPPANTVAPTPRPAPVVVPNAPMRRMEPPADPRPAPMPTPPAARPDRGAEPKGQAFHSNNGGQLRSMPRTNAGFERGNSGFGHSAPGMSHSNMGGGASHPSAGSGGGRPHR